jgi:hypothetical protein
VGADAYLLSDILHDWNDDHARKILAGCRRAAAPNGSVVVIEPVRGRGADTAMDLFMLMCFGGRERTVDELARLATDCGLMLHDSGPVAEGRTGNGVGSRATHGGRTRDYRDKEIASGLNRTVSRPTASRQTRCRAHHPSAQLHR